MNKPGDAYETICSWFARSQVDYPGLYAQLYIAYNAWYRKVTGASSDYEALVKVKRRIVIWGEYAEGRTLCRLYEPAAKIARLTTEHPLRATSSWSGQVNDAYDWRGLIQFWHRVRCDLVHGVTPPSDYLSQKYIYLAYMSLSAFMEEIVARMNRAFTEVDQKRLGELNRMHQDSGGLSEAHQHERELLHARYIQAPAMWEVDMVRASKITLYSSAEKRYNQAYTS